MERSELSDFYAKNVGLIKKVSRAGAARAAAIGGQLTESDLEQEMTEVFIRAFDSYDPSTFRFSTYYMRSAFNRLNYLMEKVGKERIENRTFSVEEMATWNVSDDGDELGVLVEDVTSMRPEEAAQLQSLMRTWSKQLSPLAQTLMSWTIEPPEFIEREFLAQMRHTEVAKELGFSRRSRQVIDAAFVCSVMRRMVKKEEVQMVKDALEEIKVIAKNTL